MAEEVKVEESAEAKTAGLAPELEEELVPKRNLSALQSNYDKALRVKDEALKSREAKIQELEAAHAETQAALRARQEDEAILGLEDQDEMKRLSAKFLKEGRAAEDRAAETTKRADRREAQAYELARQAVASKLCADAEREARKAGVEFSLDEAELLKIPVIEDMTIFALSKQNEALLGQVVKQKARPGYERGEGGASGVPRDLAEASKMYTEGRLSDEQFRTLRTKFS